MNTHLSLCLAVVMAFASSPAGAQMAAAPAPLAAAAMPIPASPADAAPAAAPAPAPLGVLLRPNPDLARPLRYEITARPSDPDPDRLVSFARHVALGMAIGGVVGFAYGMTERDNDAFGLSPVIETVIGVGLGGYAGTGLFLLKDLR